MKIVKKPKIQVIEKKEEKEEEIVENKGLGESIILVGTEKKPIIKIKKTFDRSWEIVDQALKLNEIKIKDKDRERGVFFVKYDPDDQNADESSLVDKMTFFMFKDEYAEASYKLTVAWQESDTEVIAEMVDSETNDLLDDGEDDDNNDDGTTDSGGKLLDVLYKTIKVDLPIN
ncbi:MAG: outer membrane protein assembly factor BamC [Methylococcales bacterium]|nr:outer membrane protein assembly factor BamC [Methylococcales bacterium]